MSLQSVASVLSLWRPAKSSHSQQAAQQSALSQTPQPSDVLSLKPRFGFRKLEAIDETRPETWPYGATPLANGHVLFKVWAPEAKLGVSLVKFQLEDETERKQLLQALSAKVAEHKRSNDIAEAARREGKHPSVLIRDQLVQILRAQPKADMFKTFNDQDLQWAAALLESLIPQSLDYLENHLRQMARSKRIPVLGYADIKHQLKQVGSAKPMERSEENGAIYTLKVDSWDLDKDVYMYQVNNRLLPDPYSLYQPKDVHGPSQAIALEQFKWTDAQWPGILDSRPLISYRLHVGAFSPEGTLEGLRKKIAYIKELGFNAIELMPITEFPGDRNWGYDPANLFAVENAYGTPRQLQELVNECHRQGIAVMTDMVYNHVTSDGNYLNMFDKSFTSEGHTWGAGFNWTYLKGLPFDYIIDNVKLWLQLYHIDGFRLDMTQEIKDRVLKAIVNTKKEIPRGVFLAAEHGVKHPGPGEDPEEVWRKNADPVRVTRKQSPDKPGDIGMDARWDFFTHHSLKSIGSGSSYKSAPTSLKGFKKEVLDRQDLQRSTVYDQCHDETYYGYRNWDRNLVARRNGTIYGTEGSDGRISQGPGVHKAKLFALFNLPDSVNDSPYKNGGPDRDEIYARGWDYAKIQETRQKLIENKLIDPQLLRAQTIFQSLLKYVLPGFPLHFMGDEWGAKTPFHFIGSYIDLGTYWNTQRDRFENGLPDPMAESTFQDSKLRWESEVDPQWQKVTQDILRLRKSIPALWQGGQDLMGTDATTNTDGRVMTLWRKNTAKNPTSRVFVVLNRSDQSIPAYGIRFPRGEWKEVFNTDNIAYGGSWKLDSNHIISSGNEENRQAVHLPAWGVVIFEKVERPKPSGSFTRPTRNVLP